MRSASRRINGRPGDLLGRIEAGIEEIVAEANDSGFGTKEALDALEAALRRARTAYEADPDPAADPLL